MGDSFDKTLSGGKFDEVFTEVTHSEILGLNNPEQLHLFHSNVNNNTFSSDGLEVFLRKNIGQYVFSRAKIEDYRMHSALAWMPSTSCGKTALPNSEVPETIWERLCCMSFWSRSLVLQKS